MTNYRPINSLETALQENVVFAEDWEEFRKQFTDLWRTACTKINDKERSFYPVSLEITNNQKIFTVGQPSKFREAFRKVFTHGAIAAGATATIAHNIDRFTTFTDIYGTCICTDGLGVREDRPLPYPSAAAATDGIELRVKAGNIEIINGATGIQIESAIVILEYVKT